MKIIPIQALPPEFGLLVREAESEGHEFLTKMKSEWVGGTNRFEKGGEVLLAAIDETGAAIAVGGSKCRAINTA